MANRVGRPRDLTRIGETYARLTIISATRRDDKPAWDCLCICGNTHVVKASEWGTTKSCGCFRVEMGKARTTHGKHGSPIYEVWHGMKQRCSNPNAPAWHNYGGRGIAVCKRWLVFENFYADMGEPQPGTTLDRKNNDKGYSPSNCRWATPIVQANNRRTNVRFLSETHGLITTTEAALLSKHSVQVIHWRVYKMKMSIDMAMTTPKLRARSKGGLDDIKKAHHYLTELIEFSERLK